MRIQPVHNNIDFAADLGVVTVKGDTPTAALSSSPSWGTGGSVGAVVTAGSTDLRGTVTCTAGTGGTPAANGTVTITFAKAFETAPHAVVGLKGGTAHTLADPVAITWATSTTALTITNLDTCGAGETVILSWVVLG